MLNLTKETTMNVERVNSIVLELIRKSLLKGLKPHQEDFFKQSFSVGQSIDLNEIFADLSEIEIPRQDIFLYIESVIKGVRIGIETASASLQAAQGYYVDVLGEAAEVLNRDLKEMWSRVETNLDEISVEEIAGYLEKGGLRLVKD